MIGLSESLDLTVHEKCNSFRIFNILSHKSNNKLVFMNVGFEVHESKKKNLKPLSVLLKHYISSKLNNKNGLQNISLKQ